ncbi:MAG: hypothetical protein J1E02_05190 [Coprobacter sp.]|nr:hypothetical protein [Coprobacter sp.]
MCSCLLCLVLFAAGCGSGGDRALRPEAVEIVRFDRELAEAFGSESAAQEAAFAERYGAFVRLYCEGVLNLSPADSGYPVSGLRRFFSAPPVKRLYEDTERQFADLRDTERGLGLLFGEIARQFPEAERPLIYSHVSGMNQSYVVTDSVISIALDNFLGADYPGYGDVFYDYQRLTKTPDYIVPGVALVWLYDRFPYREPNGPEMLLDRMIYEGKILYAAERLLPETPTAYILGYSPVQAEWLSKNERIIWDRMLRQQDLFSTDGLTRNKYIAPAPFTAPLTLEAPGRAGRWTGWRIVSEYMRRHRDVSLLQLLTDSVTESREILRLSKYNGN